MGLHEWRRLYRTGGARPDKKFKAESVSCVGASAVAEFAEFIIKFTKEEAMFRRTPKSLFYFFMWAILCFLAVPVFAQGAAPSTAPAAGWTPANWIALITAIGSFITGIIGAVKGFTAQKTADNNSNRLAAHDGQIQTASNLGAGAQQKADANEQRLNAVSNRLNMHGEQLNNLAQKIPSA